MKSWINKAVTLMLVFAAVAAGPKKAHADITDSNLFEPVLLCVAGGTAGYIAGNYYSPGNDILIAALSCGGGALIGVLLDSYYEHKYSKVYKEDLAKLRGAVREMNLTQAMRITNGNDDEHIGTVLRTVSPPEKLPNGSVVGPKIEEQLVLPGETVRIGGD